MPGDRISDSPQRQHAVHRPARHAAATPDISTSKTTTRTTTTKLRWKQFAAAATAAAATTPSGLASN